jgi:hypothetical protein
MTFNIRNQTAGVINNVAGDQTVHGGQGTNVVTLEATRSSVEALRRALEAASIDPSTRTAAADVLDELGTELAKDEPNQPKVAGRLEQLTSLLKSAGALAAAGAALTAPIQTLATWLGQLGEPILRLLAA